MAVLPIHRGAANRLMGGLSPELQAAILAQDTTGQLQRPAPIDPRFAVMLSQLPPQMISGNAAPPSFQMGPQVSPEAFAQLAPAPVGMLASAPSMDFFSRLAQNPVLPSDPRTAPSQFDMRSAAEKQSTAGTPPFAQSPANSGFENNMATVGNTLHALFSAPTRLAAGVQNYFTKPGQGGPPAAGAPGSDGYKALMDGITAAYGAQGGAAAGAGGGGGGGYTAAAFDPSGHYAALASIDEAVRLSNAPITATTNTGPRPAVPQREALAKTDWQPYDAALVNAAPRKPTESEFSDLRRSSTFAGLARGAATIDEETGWGTALLKMGMGLLAGRSSGDVAVQERLDAYDEKNSRYQLLVANGEKDKAQQVRREAEVDGEIAFDNLAAKAKDEMDKWEERRGRIENGRLIVRGEPDAEGNTTVTSYNFSNAAAAEGAVKKASVYESLSTGINATMRSNADNANANFRTNSALAARAGLSQDGSFNPMIIAAQQTGRFLDEGGFHAMPGFDKILPELEKRAQSVAETAVPMNMTGSVADQQRLEVYRATIVGDLTQVVASNRAIRDRVFGPMTGAARRAAPVIKVKKEGDR